MTKIGNHNGEGRRQGRIGVICGGMFFGKTEELTRRMKRAKFAKQRVEVFKPPIDTHYSDEDVVDHDQNNIHSTPTDSSNDIPLLVSDIDVVGIDEAQLPNKGLANICNKLANNGVRVIVVGLDMDFKGVPFSPVPVLCAIADEVTKVYVICMKCGALAYVNRYLTADDRRAMLGEQQEYEPLRCECYKKTTQEEINNK